MSDDARRAALRQVGIRGRVAFALVCIERALQRGGVRDPRIGAVLRLLWRFVEERDFTAVDAARRDHPVVRELLDAVDNGWPIPPSYGKLPAYLPSALNAALWIGLAEMYGAIVEQGQESLDLTLHVAELCAHEGIVFPPVRPFTAISFSDEAGWGRVTSRAAILDALAGYPSDTP